MPWQWFPSVGFGLGGYCLLHPSPYGYEKAMDAALGWFWNRSPFISLLTSRTIEIRELPGPLLAAAPWSGQRPALFCVDVPSCVSMAFTLSVPLHFCFSPGRAGIKLSAQPQSKKSWAQPGPAAKCFSWKCLLPLGGYTWPWPVAICHCYDGMSLGSSVGL